MMTINYMLLGNKRICRQVLEELPTYSFQDIEFPLLMAYFQKTYDELYEKYVLNEALIKAQYCDGIHKYEHFSKNVKFDRLFFNLEIMEYPDSGGEIHVIGERQLDATEIAHFQKIEDEAEMMQEKRNAQALIREKAQYEMLKKKYEGT